MKKLQNNVDSTAEDGHPCEAALEFRRSVIRADVAREISADALDLAISFAWIGKAISRSGALSKWLLSKIDPNCEDFVRALSSSDQIRRTALADALTAAPTHGREAELQQIRGLQGFKQAVQILGQITGASPDSKQVLRLSELHLLALNLPGKQPKQISASPSDNIVLFPGARKSPKGKTRNA
jgi:hypothetical protein